MADTKLDPFDLSAGVPPIEGDLRPKPKMADRISKRVVVVAFGIVALLMALFLVSIDQIDNKPVKKEDKKVKKLGDDKVKQAPADVLGEPDPGAASSGGKSETKPATLVPTNSPEKMLEQFREATGMAGAKPGAPAAKPKDGGNVPAVSGMIPAGAGGGNGVPAQLTPEQQAAAMAKQERLAQLRQARATGLNAKPFNDGADAVGKAVAPGMDALKSTLEQMAKQQGGGGGFAPEQKKASVDGEQEEKLRFVKDAAKDGAGYHPYMPVPAVSKNEVKMGAFIPMTLQQGINSDLPGQVTARVSEGVYDTIDGCRLLIPPLTTAVGKYDSKIALGQSRILVVWNALIFPDGSELNLAGMQSYDTSGMTGLQSETDNHYLRLFGVGLGMSLISGAAQMAVPPPPSGTTSTVPTYSQSVASALSQQFGQLGGQLMGKFAAVQPTLRNYFGEQFEIMVPRTIVFNKVWSNRCMREARN